MSKITKKLAEVLSCMSASFVGLIVIPALVFFCYFCQKVHNFNPLKDAIDNILFYYLYN